ncbi:DUF6415 family natural product biosynthesis protein [Streptomyces sp. NPDC050433]|uniref:DUF6415 family natural product biosynthesis protein n=1 Tax=Streptomyces sp. NPDC050433 TaxID=3365615 RepID=UPI0037ABAA37
MDETTYLAMQSTFPLDISTMTAAAAALLDDVAEPPVGEALILLTLQLRGHLNLLIPELERRCAVAGPRDEACAQAGIGEARRRLAADPSSLGPVRHATLLARSVEALCRHFQRLADPDEDHDFLDQRRRLQGAGLRQQRPTAQHVAPQGQQRN